MAETRNSAEDVNFGRRLMSAVIGTANIIQSSTLRGTASGFGKLGKPAGSHKNVYLAFPREGKKLALALDTISFVYTYSYPSVYLVFFVIRLCSPYYLHPLTRLLLIALYCNAYAHILAERYHI